MRVRRTREQAAPAAVMASSTPHEMQILGDCFQSLTEVTRCRAEGLKPEHFAARELRVAWEELVRQRDAGAEVCDLYAVQSALRQHAGMDAFAAAAMISRLDYIAADSISAQQHARRLLEHRARELGAGAAQALASALMVHDDAAAREARLVYAGAQEQLDRLGKPKVSPADLVRKVVNGVEHPEQVLRIPTGLDRLDQHLGGGLAGGWLVIVLGSAKMGKSALAINNIARHALRQQRKRVLVVSQELTGEEIVQRWLAAESGIPVRLLQAGTLADSHWSRLVEAEQEVASWRFVIEGPVQGVEDLCAIAEREHREGGLDLIVAENLQLFDNGLENRVEDLSVTTRRAKLLARKLGIPLVLCSQPNNDAAKNKAELGFFDGKGSGSIAADCDLMLVPRRDAPPNTSRAGLSIPGGRHVEPVKWDLGELRFLGARMLFEEC